MSPSPPSAKLKCIYLANNFRYIFSTFHFNPFKASVSLCFDSINKFVLYKAISYSKVLIYLYSSFFLYLRAWENL